jgi:hypothetical protein
MHDDCAASRWYSPTAQPAQLRRRPPGENVPSTHVTGWVEPPGHELPGGHAWQSSALLRLLMLPHVPGAQLSGIMELLPAGHTNPGSQALHDAWLSSSWYIPSTQLAHSALLVLADVPVLQLRGALEPTTQKPPAGQGTQSAGDAPPGAARYEPSAHSVTALAPAPHQPPASHGSHAVALDDDW